MIRYTIDAERRRVRPHKSNNIMIIIYPVIIFFSNIFYFIAENSINQEGFGEIILARCSSFEQFRAHHLDIFTTACYLVFNKRVIPCPVSLFRRQLDSFHTVGVSSAHRGPGFYCLFPRDLLRGNR